MITNKIQTDVVEYRTGLGQNWAIALSLHSQIVAFNAQWHRTVPNIGMFVFISIYS